MKLNSRGFGHHLALMLVVVLSVAGFGAYRILTSNANTNQYTYTKPNGCKPGKLPDNKTGRCQLYNKIENVRDDCAQYKLQFNGTSCEENCIAGWYVGTNGQCNELQRQPDPTPPPTNTGGGGGGQNAGGGSSNDKTRADCDRLNRDFNTSNKQCGECKSGFQNAPGQERGACVVKPASSTPASNTGTGQQVAGSTDKTRADCDRLNRDFNTSNKQCGQCKSGFQNAPGQERGACVVKPTAAVSAPTTVSTTTNQVATVAAATTKAQCEALHRDWNGSKKTCEADCEKGYKAATDGVCIKKGEQQVQTLASAPQCEFILMPDGSCVKKKNVKDYCDFNFLKYDEGKNRCEDTCKKGYTKANGVCTPKNTEPTAGPAVLNVDTGLDKAMCATLGREWVSGSRDAQGNVVKGCSTNSCEKNGVTVVAQTDAAPYCRGYISKNDQKTCENQLHRKWVAVANGCMKNPKDKSAGAREASAPQCQKEFSTYVWKGSADECINPNVADRLASIAQATGKPFSSLTNMTQAQLCNIQRGKSWNGSKCVADKPAQAVNGNVSTPPSDPTNTTTSKADKAPNGTSWESYCANLGRSVIGHCGTCTSSANMLYGTDSYGWRRCVSKSTVCREAGGSKTCCPAGSIVRGTECYQHGGTTSTTSPTGNHGCPAGQSECGAVAQGTTADNPFVVTSCTNMAATNTRVRCYNAITQKPGSVCNKAYTTMTLQSDKGGKFFRGPVCSLV